VCSFRFVACHHGCVGYVDLRDVMQETLTSCDLQQAEHATDCAWCLLPAVQIRKIKFRTLGNANNGKHSGSAGLESNGAGAVRGADSRSGSAAAAGCSATDGLYMQ
jgi:hypothetical protein